jgi:protein TonB
MSMSDPMNDRAAGGSTPSPEGLSRNDANPLLWLLLLVALLAVGWYFYNRNAGSTGTTEDESATQAAVAGADQAAATAERESSALHRKPKASAAKRVASATKPANRIASPLNRVQPDYPAAAQRRHSEGTVVVRVSVGADGMPTDVAYAERSGDIELDRAALQSVREWRFQPALKDGKAIASTVDVPVDFKLLK